MYAVPDGGYDYSHHASLGVEGQTLYAYWSNGRDGEDRAGQVQRWSRRSASGAWSRPELLTRAPLADAPRTLAAINGGTSRDAARVRAFYSAFRGSGSDFPDVHSKWAPPVVTGVAVFNADEGLWEDQGILLDDFLLNEGPHRCAGGRWLMTGEDHAGRTRVAYSDALDPAAAAWQVTAVAQGAGPRFKNEPTWYQRDDGTVVLWLRDDGGSHRLWVAESMDDGLTWSEPLPTNLPSSTSKCHVGRLRAGAYYSIWNPNLSGRRIPLVIGLSDDGELFDRVAILRDEPSAPTLPGRYKDGGYAYPNALEVEQTLHIIYSVNKENVCVQSIPLKELEHLARI